MVRRWYGDGTEMARRWHGDGTEGSFAPLGGKHGQRAGWFWVVQARTESVWVVEHVKDGHDRIPLEAALFELGLKLWSQLDHEHLPRQGPGLVSRGDEERQVGDGPDREGHLHCDLGTKLQQHGVWVLGELLQLLGRRDLLDGRLDILFEGEPESGIGVGAGAVPGCG
jgi:hypothetical protein